MTHPDSPPQVSAAPPQVSDWNELAPESSPAGAPATFGRRLGARVVDFAVWLAVLYALDLVAPALTGSGDGRTSAALAVTAVAGAWWVLWLVVPIARGGATVGKRLCRIGVVRADGTPLTFGRAVSREAFVALSFVIPMVGVLNVLAAVNDPRRQALHDRITDTVVPDRG